MRLILIILGFLISSTVSGLVQAQTIVMPRTAGQNLVRWRTFDWKYIDILNNKDLGKGVRLYYYETESQMAKRAAASIETEYRELVRKFHYTPTARIPYILYNSHQEFEQTNLFFVSEHVLGVTSPSDLKMAIAYWGDHTRFRHTSLHEMVHQFTIQKVNSVASEAQASGSPLLKIPLWFIEGIAEWYSTPGGLDTEAEMYLRDLVVNQDAFRGYVIPPFLSDDFRSFVYTYKLGQGRVHFLVETYGESSIQEILRQSYRMRGYRRAIIPETGPPTPETPSTAAYRQGMTLPEEVLDFTGLLKLVTEDSIEETQQKWEAWLKRRYFKQYLESEQDFSDYRELPGTPEYTDLFAAAHDGNVVVYRGAEPYTGLTRLYITDVRDPTSKIRLVTDGHPGIDSLHFFERPIAALTENKLAFVARNGPTDILYIYDYEHDTKKDSKGKVNRARINLGKKAETFDPLPHGIVEMGSPAFSPKGDQIAFIGLTEVGNSDLFILDIESKQVARLTKDVYAEKELDWGSQGIAYNADATEHGQYNLFHVNPTSGRIQRIGWTEENQRHPAWTPDGKSITYSGDGKGKWDIYSTSWGPQELGATTRLTDFPTGLTQGRILGDQLLAMGLKSGRMHLFAVPLEKLKKAEDSVQKPRTYASWIVPTRPLTQPQDYSAWTPRSWKLEDAFIVLSSSAFGQGYLLFNDQLRDHTLVFDFSVFGSFKLTSAQLLYLNRKQRLGWGSALFHQAYLFLDPVTSEEAPPPTPNSSWVEVIFVERTMGAAGILEFPLSRYFKFTGGLGLGAILREPCYYEFTWTETTDGLLFPAQRGTCNQFKFGEFADYPDKYNTWKKTYGETDGVVQLSAAVGFDTLSRSYQTGPLAGNSALLHGEWNTLPLRGSSYGELQLDLQHYTRLWRTANLGFRAAGGTSFGDQFTRLFSVWPVYNLRGIPFRQSFADVFVGKNYVVTSAELQFPLDRLIRIAIFQNIEGVAAIDAGSVFDNLEEAQEHQTASFVTGFNFNLAIFEFRLHFARPFDIGGLKPGTDLPDGWVTQFWIDFLFF